MSNKRASKKAKFQRLREKFVSRLSERLSTIRDLATELCSPHASVQNLIDLHILVHNLSGSAGTFEVRSISNLAIKLELKLADYINRGTLPEPEDWETIHSAIHQLEELIKTIKISDAVILTSPKIDHSISNSSLVYLVEDDEEQAEHISQILREGGYEVETFTKPDEFRNAYARAESRPGAILMDLVFPEGDEIGTDLMKDLGLGKQHGTPVILLSVRSDIQARLTAFRAGACRYLQKPFDRSQLIGTLDGVTGRQPEKPFRVLLVDDDPDLLEVEADILREVGMEVRAISDPLKTLEVIEHFEPEVIILDVYMPGATGPELAAVLREQEAQLQVPILFLSSETDMTQQLQALTLGGDDFLVKPISPEHFILAVTARASRARHNKVIQRRLELTLYEREREHLAINHHAGISVTNKSGLITEVNDRFCEMSGFTRDELIGKKHHIFKSDKHSEDFYENIRQTISGGQSWHGEICNQDKAGFLYWVDASIVPFLDNNGNPYQYVSVQTDITENKLQQQKLTDARNDAEKANRYKSEFISNMSHELRTPLNAIMGFGQLLKESKLSEEDRESINYIVKAGSHLTSMINEILDIARIESGKYDFVLEPVLLRDALSDAWGLISPLAAGRKVDLSSKASEIEPVYVKVDAQRLRQIFINLLSNAIKYNKQGGSISLQCKITPADRVRINIEDNGIGIEGNDLERVFEPFTRVGSKQEEVEGSGIGLAVTKALVENMNGKIGCNSEVGKGSTFWVEFPIHRLTHDETKNLKLTQKRTTPTKKAAKILYIEDNKVNARLMETALKKRSGLELISAENGETGIDLALAHHPNLILLDLHLPGLSGSEVLDKLKSFPQTSDIPVIVISADATKVQKEKLKNSGIRAYLTKPVELSELYQAINTAISKNRNDFVNSE